MKIIKDISVSEFNTLSWLSFKFGFDMTDLDEYSKDIEISNSDAGDLKELIKSTLKEGVDKVNREKNLKSLFKKIGAVDNFIDIDINGRDFKLYIARSDEDKSRGLEAVSSLAADKGMYFPFDGNQYVTFHMGKVQFPIDIVFLSDFEITKIIKNAQPGSTDRWSAMADTVIELSGGICDEYNINEGDGCTKVLASKKGSKINHLKNAIASFSKSAATKQEIDQKINDMVKGFNTAEDTMLNAVRNNIADVPDAAEDLLKQVGDGLDKVKVMVDQMNQEATRIRQLLEA